MKAVECNPLSSAERTERYWTIIRACKVRGVPRGHHCQYGEVIVCGHCVGGIPHGSCDDTHRYQCECMKKAMKSLEE